MIAAVVLAAGRGKRFYGDVPKLLVPFRKKPLILWAVEAALESGIGPVMVVEGAVELKSVLPKEVTVISTEAWSEGAVASLLTALDYAAREGFKAVVVGFGDEPLIGAESWKRVAEEKSRPIVVATYRGKRGRPIKIEASLWPLIPLGGDDLKYVLKSFDENLIEEVEGVGECVSIDTRADLLRWGSNGFRR